MTPPLPPEYPLRVPPPLPPLLMMENLPLIAPPLYPSDLIACK